MTKGLVLDKKELAKGITIDVIVKSSKTYDFRFWLARKLIALAVFVGNFTLGEVVVRMKD
jgi:hypothetical protein